MGIGLFTFRIFGQDLPGTEKSKITASGVLRIFSRIANLVAARVANESVGIAIGGLGFEWDLDTR